MTRALIAVRTRVLQSADKDNGATAVEYGLMVSLIAVVIITSVALLGTTLDGIFAGVAGAL
jgi:pilus assembly protein Flp/PilA